MKLAQNDFGKCSSKEFILDSDKNRTRPSVFSKNSLENDLELGLGTSFPVGDYSPGKLFRCSRVW